MRRSKPVKVGSVLMFSDREFQVLQTKYIKEKWKQVHTIREYTVDRKSCQSFANECGYVVWVMVV